MYKAIFRAVELTP